MRKLPAEFGDDSGRNLSRSVLGGAADYFGVVFFFAADEVHVFGVFAVVLLIF